MLQSGGKSTNVSRDRLAQVRSAAAVSGWLGWQSRTIGSRVIGNTRTPSGTGPVTATNAASTVLAATCSMSAADPSWRSRTATPGCAARNPASTAGTSTPAMHCSAPTRSVPRSRPRTAAAVSLVAAAPASARRASASTARPTSVSSTCRVERTNKGAPSSRSSARIEAESPDCDTSIRRAARVKCRSSATATKYSS